ncbi:hypothetical protein [Streptomyces alanosinicus]|uniref:Uncharacterized protein n=1 Tax=Streptomyces alanosinicus TaxID=68171 RepID=A0A918IPQ0_9ACTN|nr:hypothetical protein [Streptomyces alanosinicus]GGW24581.1 hypothetical protein GCM10010339_94370 [Streptomyces alanosinicus]
MPGPEPDEPRPAGTKRRRVVRVLTCMQPAVVVLKFVYYAVRVVRELMD